MFGEPDLEQLLFDRILESLWSKWLMNTPLKACWDILKLSHAAEENLDCEMHLDSICGYHCRRDYPLSIFSVCSVNASFMPAVIRFSGSTSIPFVKQAAGITLFDSDCFSNKKAGNLLILKICSFSIFAHFWASDGAVICGLSPWSGMVGQAVN